MAGNTGGIRAGKSFIEVYADNSLLVRGLKQAEKQIGDFGAKVAGLGLKFIGLGSSVLAPLAAAAVSFANAGSRLDDMSQRTGVSVESLSALDHAATMSGTSLETLEGGLRKLGNAVIDAARGSDTAAAALDAVGLKASQLVRLSPDRQLAKVADGLMKIKNPAERTAAAMDLFGKSGAELVPLLSGGSKGLAEFKAEAEKLGIVMSGKDAGAAAALGDAFDNLKAAAGGVVNAIGAALGPALTDILTTITGTVAGVSKFVSANREMILLVAKVAAGVVIAGGALVGIGVAIAGVGAVVGAFGTILSGLAAAAGVVGSALAFLISGPGLIVVALAAATGAILYFSGAGSAMATAMKTAFGELLKVGKAVFGGISDALKAGDLELAGRVAMEGLKYAFTAGIGKINELWIGAKTLFMDVWSNAVTNLAVAMTNLWAGMETGWTNFLSKFTSGWITVQGLIAKASVKLKAMFDPSINEDMMSGIIDSVSNVAQGKNESDRKKSVDQIEENRVGANAELVDQNERDRMSRETANNAALADGRARLEAAKRDLDAAVEEARKKAAEAAGGTEVGKAGGVDLDALRITKENKISTTGTFSAAAVGGLAGSNYARDQLAEMKNFVKIAREQLAESKKKKGLVFP